MAPTLVENNSMFPFDRQNPNGRPNQNCRCIPLKFVETAGFRAGTR